MPQYWNLDSLQYSHNSIQNTIDRPLSWVILAEDPATSVLFIRNDLLCILNSATRRADIGRTPYVPFITLITWSTQHYITDIAYDQSNDKIYFLDVSTRRLWRWDNFRPLPDQPFDITELPYIDIGNYNLDQDARFAIWHQTESDIPIALIIGITSTQMLRIPLNAERARLVTPAPNPLARKTLPPTNQSSPRQSSRRRSSRTSLPITDRETDNAITPSLLLFKRTASANTSVPVAPTSISIDNKRGTAILTSPSLNRVYECNIRTGLIVPLCGNGEIGSTGDGGPPLQASLSNPSQTELFYYKDYIDPVLLSEDSANLLRKAHKYNAGRCILIADSGANNIRKVVQMLRTTYTLTLAGNGSNSIPPVALQPSNLLSLPVPNPTKLAMSPSGALAVLCCDNLRVLILWPASIRTVFRVARGNVS